MNRPLDYIDRRILDELQADGRLSIVELANRVNLTKTPCAERVRRLERSGVIRGYRALINPEHVDRPHVTIVHISLEQTSDGALDVFNKEVAAMPEVETCLMIAGQFDYMLKVRTKDIAHYRTVLTDKIGKLPGVKQTHSFAVMETVKDTHDINMSSIESQLL